MTPMMRGEAITDQHALEADASTRQTEPDVLRAGDEERIDDEIARLAPDLATARKVAPGREQRISQTIRISASMISGGRTRAARALSRGASLLAKARLRKREPQHGAGGGRRGARRGIAAVACGLEQRACSCSDSPSHA